MMVDNQQLREMAKIALENWLFDQDTDPDGDIQRGLAYLAEPGDWDEEIISARVTGPEDWDGLGEWAAFLGQDDMRPVDIITLTEAHELHPEIPRSTLNEWARLGKVSAWLSGRTWLTTRQALDEAIARLRPQKGEGKVAIGDEVVVTRDMAIVEYADGTGSYKARKGWVLGGFAGTDGDRIVVHSNHRESGEPVEVIVDKEDVKVG